MSVKTDHKYWNFMSLLVKTRGLSQTQFSVHSKHTIYYRATLCWSAVFAVAGCPSVRPSSVPLSLCLSVCLSVCQVGYCIQTAKDIVKLLSRPGSLIILDLIPAPIPIAREPLQRGR